MSTDKINNNLDQSLEEFYQYLSDLIPPLVAADSVELLLKCSPDGVAAGIHSWVSTQLRAGRSIPVSDYFYHAVKKIHMLGEYHLIKRETIKEFLEQLKPYLVEYCPPSDREIFKRNMDVMESAAPASSSASQIEVIYRQVGTESQQNSGTQQPRTDAEIPAVGLLIERIKRELTNAAKQGESGRHPAQEKAVSEALAQAARSTHASMELKQMLDHFHAIGIQAGTQELFRALGKDLPEWSLQLKPEVQLPENSSLKAMRRMITQADDSRESAVRFRQMVKTAVERFNAGHLAQAVSMIDLAEKIIATKEVDQTVIDHLRIKGHDDLDIEHLRKYAEAPQQHGLLRRMLNFYQSLTPQGLITSLTHESKRERRRLILALLEAHGDSTRDAAMQSLNAPLNANLDVREVYLRRNLLYLLRRIPPRPEESQSDLIGMLSRHATLEQPVILLKEAVACLGQIKHENSEEVLNRLLKDIENMLVNSSDAPLESGELLQLLDRVCAALARVGTDGARRTLLDHAFKKKPKLGDTTGRLSELSSQDLSSDLPTVERLLSALEQNLPKKFLGLLMQQKDREIQPIVEALSGTPLPIVRQTLENIAQKYPNRASGRAAKKALSSQTQQVQTKRSTTESSVSSLNGDLEFFGLPALFQSLSDNTITGRLTLKTPAGEKFGMIDFENGKLCFCETGKLTGDTALYQLLERPQPGTFEFVRSAERHPNGKISKEMMPLILEGIRRYDEFQQSRAVLPDDVRLITKGGQPTQHPDEKDGLLFRELWNAVRMGATPIECENAVALDSYRTRRLLLHWVESGSLSISYDDRSAAK